KPVYLAPEPLPALPAASAHPIAKPQPAASTPQLPAPTGIRKAQAVQEVTPPPPRGGLVPPVRKSVVADTSETDRRVDRLKRQLEELNQLLSRPPVDPPVIERPFVTPFSDPVPTHTERPPIKERPPVQPAVVAPEPSHSEPPHTESVESPRPQTTK